MVTDFTKQAKEILDESTRQAKDILDESTRQARGILDKSTQQARDILDESSARIIELGGEGLKVAERFRTTVENTMENTRARGKKAVVDFTVDLSPEEIKKRLGISEIIDKLNVSEVTRHGEAIRQELLSALNLPTVEVVDELTVNVKKLDKELSAFKTLKTEIRKIATVNKKLTADNANLKDTIKKLKTEQKAGLKALKTEWKADLKAFKAVAKAKKTTKKATK